MALSSRFRGFAPPVACLCWAAVACSTTSTDDDSTVDRTDPPVLAFLGATAADGTAFDADASEIELGCDARLTFHFDRASNEEPSTALWDMQPPGLCADDETDACGYLRVDLESDSGDRLARSEAALYDVFTDLSSLREDVALVRAVFIQGTTRQPYERKGKTFEKTWSVEIVVPSDCGSSGGSGGGSGSGGSPPLGGAGGLGGVGGAS